MAATTTLPVLFATGDHASRPAAGTPGVGALYSCTTHSLIYQTNGSTWSTWATLGGTSGLTSIPAASVTLTTGSITSSHGMANFAAITATALDLTIAAATGDVLEITVGRLINFTTTGGEVLTDVATVVTGSLTNYVSGGSSSSGGLVGLYVGVTGLHGQSDTVLYTVQAGDISGGNVTLRPVYLNSDVSNNATIYATTAYRFHFSVKNLKH